MKYVLFVIALTLLTLQASCSFWTGRSRGVAMLMPKPISGQSLCRSPEIRSSPDGKLKLIVEDEKTFEHLYRSIRERAVKSSLSDLRTTALPPDDLEVRFWTLPSFHPAYGLVLKRTDGQWTAQYLLPVENNESLSLPEPFPEPLEGWSRFWNSLVEEHLLTLPDCHCVDDCNATIDGIGYVIEISLNGAYRSYGYGAPPSVYGLSPSGQEKNESAQFMKILRLISPHLHIESVK